MTPLDMLERVTAVLDANGVRYEADRHHFSINGGPDRTRINLNRNVDPQWVQRQLDTAGE